MKILTGNIPLKLAAVALLLLVAILCLGSPSVSDDFSDRRITAGAKIFRALLAADSDIEKKADSDGILRLCLIYDDDRSNVQLASTTLLNRKDARIRDKDIMVGFFSYEDLMQENHEWTAGIFLTQQLSDSKLADIVEFAKEHGVVLFSPFDGDVERGVLGGIKVEARVQPYLNLGTLRESRIRLKSFFMRVAKIHGK